MHLSAKRPSRDLSIAVVCSSNQNRSMEAHYLLQKRGFRVRSFGTGAQVKLPGSSPSEPNVYKFDTSYAEMHEDLSRRDLEFYTQNGLLSMLERNKRMKIKPERFQECHDRFHLIFTVEDRVFDILLEDLYTRPRNDFSLLRSWTASHSSSSSGGLIEPSSGIDSPAPSVPLPYDQQPTLAHLVNIQVEDNHDEAKLGSFLIADFVKQLSETADLDNDIEGLLAEFERLHPTRTPVLHSVFVYA
jgi:RNA polymerase II subunit A C-terminal domain phosphatase SSU72